MKSQVFWCCMATNDPFNGQEQLSEAHFDADEIDENDFQIDEYDLTSTSSDFNILTVYSFMESGAVKIPGFQRNYVWDKNKASKLIESIILGLPIPQIFLYEEGRNKFLVIDGQQRLMSIYYFIKGRFPLKEKRVELRNIFAKRGEIPNEFLYDDNYFIDFSLTLPQKPPAHPNRFNGLKYKTLDDYKTQFDLRPIRNIIVKQNLPRNDDSSIYEIFHRLNSGGVNLYPQEIRASLYHSPFYTMLNRINVNSDWRNLLKMPEADIHMKDIEILLRSFAMLSARDKYAPSLPKFLNMFSGEAKKFTDEENAYLEKLFVSFVDKFKHSDYDPFMGKRTKRFNTALFEAVFFVICSPFYKNKQLVDISLDFSKIKRLENDEDFAKSSTEGTTKKSNVEIRLRRAQEILS